MTTAAGQPTARAGRWMCMTTLWRARIRRAAALSLVLAVAPIAVATSASVSTAATASLSATSAAVRGFGHWHRESILNPISHHRVNLAAVSCAGRPHAHCVAVGDRTDPRGNDSSYSEVGNGTIWHVVYTTHPHGVGGLEPTGQTGYRLNDVSCWAPDRCIAVGDFFRKPGHERPLAERWNGHSWTVIHTPAAHDSAKLDHISCASRSACMAVGATSPGDDATAPHLVEQWTGSRWSITHPPLPMGADPVTITSVSCPSGTSCTIAGTATSSGTVTPFADTFSDGTWRTDALPATAGLLKVGQVLTVDCASPTACVMVATVGAGADIPSSYSLSGHADSWTQTSLPDGLNVTSIACTATSSCLIAGYTTDVDDEPTAAIAHWDGTSWTPIEVLADDALDISCTSGTSCVLVDIKRNHFGFFTYVHQAIGFSSAPFPKASSGGSLDNVSCPTSTMCMAVRGDGAIEREHARVWSTSRPAHSHQTFRSVSCVSPTWCMAVGFNGERLKSVTAMWNGREWRTLPRSVAEPSELELTGVSCTSRTFCLAIDEASGQIDEDSRWAQRWNGHRWRPARRPANKGRTVLTRVSCASRHFCVVVGYKQNYRVRSAIVTQVWRGSHWRPEAVVRITTRGAIDPQLASVSCVSDRFCLADGSYSQGPDFAERWNGRQWTSIQPPIGESAGEVSCESRTRCMALTSNFESQIDLEASSWNGTSWIPRPVPGPADLGDVSCVALTCTAVGLNIAVRIK
jgi:hypothetical protein